MASLRGQLSQLTLNNPSGDLKLIKTPAELYCLGRLEPLSNTDAAYAKIAKYALDGKHIPQESKLELKIHDIFHVRPNASESTASPGKNQLLLWFKTTPKSVGKLEEHVDGCISFYDRLARALAVNPKEIKKPLRQMLLLFSVSLQKIYESPKKYQHWRDEQLPQGYNSVKTVGKFIPDGRTNLDDNSTTIPCGETIVNTASPTYEADYNEFIIYEIKRAQLRYAVDVEIAPYAKVVNTPIVQTPINVSKQIDSDTESESESDDSD